MTDEREEPETETDESTQRASEAKEQVSKKDAREHTAPPTEAIILKSSD